jgi:hypothetical protein
VGGFQSFKEECRGGGLYAEFASHDQLRADFGHHLTLELNRPKYLWLTAPDVTVEVEEPELNYDEMRLLLASAADQNGQVLAGSTLQGFHVQANGEDFVDGSPRSAASWKRVLKRLAALGYLEQVSDEVYEVTEEGFARADRQNAITPLQLSLCFAGPPENQMLSVESNKPITLRRLDFLMSSGVSINKLRPAGANLCNGHSST